MSETGWHTADIIKSCAQPENILEFISGITPRQAARWSSAGALKATIIFDANGQLDTNAKILAMHNGNYYYINDLYATNSK